MTLLLLFQVGLAAVEPSISRIVKLGTCAGNSLDIARIEGSHVFDHLISSSFFPGVFGARSQGDTRMKEDMKDIFRRASAAGPASSPSLRSRSPRSPRSPPSEKAA